MTPLFLAPEGVKLRIKKIRGGKMFKKRLSNVGLKEGDCCERICSCSKGSGVILKKNNCKIAVGFGMANKIVVDVE